MPSEAEAPAQTLVPHLSVKGGNEAIEFYQKAFGATVTTRVPAEDGHRVLYAALSVNGASVYLSDEFPEFGAAASPSASTLGGTSVALHLHFPTAAHADSAFQRAVDAGAEPIMPMMDAQWGDRYGRLRDPFGHVWSFGGPLAHS
ncbi:VOC family protein [Rhodoligotrophos defluvii]|uniref:VOC family protein n=1 Tax=Rhodoligotrophos defluvii TaxID=2561934 RepID=UPI0010C951E6|nr:VOC family protein [Rhodoligotrophos defluvii]